MELVIPDGEIVDTPETLTLVYDPGQVYAGTAATIVYGFATDELTSEADWPDMRLLVDGKPHDCSVRLISVNGKSLVVTLPYLPGHYGYVLLREDRANEWCISSKMLVLPFENLAEWGDDDTAGFTQREGRVLLFAGLVTVNGWYREI